MRSLGWRCRASSQQSWPRVPGSHLSKSDPSLLASKQADPGGGPTKHSGTFVSSWLSPQLPPYPCHHLQGAPGVGLQVTGSSSQAPWPPSLLAIFNHLSLVLQGFKELVSAPLSSHSSLQPSPFLPGCHSIFTHVILSPFDSLERHEQDQCRGGAGRGLSSRRGQYCLPSLSCCYSNTPPPPWPICNHSYLNLSLHWPDGSSPESHFLPAFKETKFPPWAGPSRAAFCPLRG